MTGRELIELLQSNGSNLDNEVVILDSNDLMIHIKNVDSSIQRDDYDSDFDKSVTTISLYF